MTDNNEDIEHQDFLRHRKEFELFIVKYQSMLLLRTQLL